MADVMTTDVPATTGLREKVDACTFVVNKLTAEVRTMRSVALAEGGRWLIERGVRHRISAMKKSGGALCSHCF